MSSIGRLKLTSQGVLVLVTYSDVGNVALLLAPRPLIL
jgi:hypothetical protein